MPNKKSEKISANNVTRTFAKPHPRMIFLMSVLLMLLASQAPSCRAEESFNFEISKRTENAVRNFMKTPSLPNSLSVSAFQVGTVSQSDDVGLRKHFFSQLLAFPDIYMIYAGFETGYFSGYFRSGDTYQYTERNRGTNNTRTYWWAHDTTGMPGAYVRHRSYDPRQRGWYKETKAANSGIWSSIYVFASSNQLGLTKCEPMFNASGGLTAVLAVDYTLGDIDNFLSTEFAKDDRAVFIVEKGNGFLVGSSTLDPILRIKSGDTKPTRVMATEHPDKLVSEVSAYLDTKEWQEGLVVNDGNYIQVKNYQDGTLNWDIVVVMPAGSTDDVILAGSSTHSTITSISVLALILVIMVLIIMWSGRSKNIWKAAQPSFLVAFGVAVIAVNLSTLAFLGINSSSACLLRPWTFNVSFTALFSILFVKVHRVHSLFNNKKMKKVRMGPLGLMLRVTLIVGVELLIQLAWTAADPMKPVVIVGTGAQGEYIETVECRSRSQAFVGITIGFKAMLILWGCVLAWKTRNVHGAFAESKAIMLVMYNIAFLSLIVLMLYYFLNVSAAAKVLIQSVTVLCVSILSLALLFGARIYQVRDRLCLCPPQAAAVCPQLSLIPVPCSHHFHLLPTLLIYAALHCRRYRPCGDRTRTDYADAAVAYS